MPKVIASTYEIIREIGSGGGGIVYLARHLRLGKWVVLKADKRTLTVRPELLRREVDALKNLSHTYIPQVYDFIQEDGVVYTVMDYIEGESLDKPLARGERFHQAQVIEWGCEILEALCYLHSRPPNGILHADIKPANVMLTPQGDIRLIDFNIALALGEDGAVRVGFSRGYASPEHYGVDGTLGATSEIEQAIRFHRRGLAVAECLGRILCQETVPDGLIQTLLEQAVDVPHGFLTQSKTASSVITEALPFLQKFSDHLRCQFRDLCVSQAGKDMVFEYIVVRRIGGRPALVLVVGFLPEVDVFPKCHISTSMH